MAVAGNMKKKKLAANMEKRVARGAKKMQAKALRQARKLKEKNV